MPPTAKTPAFAPAKMYSWARLLLWPSAAAVTPHRWLIPALSITMLASYGTLYYAFAVLARPIQAELGWGSVVTTGAYSAALLIAGLSAFWIGKFIDRSGGRRLMTWGSIISGVLLLALSQVTSLYLFYAIWIGLGIAMAMTQYEAAFAVVVAAYPHTYRSRIGILTIAGGLSSTIFWPLTHALVENIGWRGATLVLGAFVLVVCVPLHWLAVPNATAHVQHRSLVAPELRTRRTPAINKILRTPVFWLIVCCFTALGFVNAAMAIHSIPLLESIGLEALAAVSLAALVGPMQVTSRFTDVLFNRNISAIQLGGLAVLLVPLGLLLLLPASGSSPLIYLFVIVYGAGIGLIPIARATAPPEFFGQQRYGAVSGLLSTPSTIARAAGPVAAAAVLMAFEDYKAVLWVLIAVGAIGAICYGVAAALHRGK